MTKKTSSYPPFVVFFDTVAILLFILILNQSKGVDFILPEDRLFQGARLIYFVDGEWHFVDTKEAVDTTAVDVIYMSPCEKQLECIAVSNGMKSSSINIIFPDHLTTEISRISTLAIKFGCSGFVSIIGKNGTVDREATFKRNSCMKTIPGVSAWVRSRHHRGAL